MRTLLLIKHALPEIIKEQPANSWRLAEAGRQSCRALAERLKPYAPSTIITSTEPKAAETGQLAARYLGLPCEEQEDLHEHERTGVEWMGRQAFESAVRLFFRQPDELAFGRETANQARARFARAVQDTLIQYPVGNLAIVAHGTVITLLTCAYNRREPFALWKRLTMPSIVVLRTPGYQLVDVIDTI